MFQNFCIKNQFSYQTFKWDGNYPKKRQWALNFLNFKSPWVLMLDDDEFIPEKFKNKLLKFNPEVDIGAFILSYDNWFMGKHLKFGIPMKKVSLVNKNYGYFQDLKENSWGNFDMEVHEHFVSQKKTEIFSSRIEHRQIDTMQKLTKKHIEYANWEISRIKSNRNYEIVTLRQRLKNKLLRSAYFPILYFVYNYFIRLGFLDGKQGLLYSILKANYFAMIASEFNEKK